METKIYCFNPVIYPFPLWVCKVGKETVDELNKLFTPCSDDWKDAGVFENSDIHHGNTATTFRVLRKKDRQTGCLVLIAMPKLVGAGICSHEALHYLAAAFEMFNMTIGTFNDSEPAAYWEQWATNCIYSVLIGKPEAMKGIPEKIEENG